MSDYITQLQRQLDLLTKRVDGLVKPEAFYSPEYVTVLSEYMMLPALRFLGAGGLGSSGQWRDLSGNGMHLTYNGNPQMGYTTQGAPYWAYDGTGDYHSHADDAHFDITGTETTVAAAVRGLTVGCWVYFANAAGTFEDVLTKYLLAGDQRSYRLYRQAAGRMGFTVSSAGTAAAAVGVTSGIVTTAATWYFTCATLWPSATLNVWLNDTEDTSAVGVPANAFSGTATFEIARLSGGGNPLTGRVAFPFVCACALSDTQITRLYNRSRGLFGV
jgi:hypothetical protein